MPSSPGCSQTQSPEMPPASIFDRKLSGNDSPLQPSIFTWGSPEKTTTKKGRNGVSARQPPERFGEFLKSCFLCKKDLGRVQVLFMYGYLGAYCSSQCREFQMKVDGFEEEFKNDLARVKEQVKSMKKDLPRLEFPS